MFRNYFKSTIRNLQRNKAYAFINIAGLSLGLACAMLIILYLKDEVSYDKFHTKGDNIYRVVNHEIDPDGSIKGTNGFTGYFQGPKFTGNIPEIKAFVRYQQNNYDIKRGEEIKSQEVFLTDSSFFSVFSFPLLSGDPKTALKQPNAVVISEDMAKDQFGTLNAVGKTIMIKDAEQFKPYFVSAVAKRSPQNSSIKFQVLLPMIVSKEDAQNDENWFNFFMNTFVLLRPGADLKSVQAKMKQVYENDAAASIKMMAEKFDVKSKTVYFLQPFTAMHLSVDLNASNGLVDASNPMFSYILSGIALFILLIACINFINLTVARSVKRAREIGIRKVIGGNRQQLILQFLGESFLLCLIAFVFAVAIVQIVLPIFNHHSNKVLAISYLLDGKLIAGYLLLFLFTSLAAGFYPAIVLSHYNPVDTLYSRFNLAGKNYLHKGLVVLQFSLATFLIIGTIVIFTQFNYLTKQPLGYDDSDLVSVQKGSLKRNEAKLFKEALLQNPNVGDVTFKNGGQWFTTAKVNGDLQVNFAYETIDETFLPLIKAQIKEGRNFSTALQTDSNTAVLVNESFAKEAGWKNPIGQTVNFWYKGNEQYKVIGVVKDYHFQPLNQKISPQLFTMKAGNDYGRALIKIKPNNAAASLTHIQRTFKKLFPLTPYSYVFTNDENLKNYEAEAKWKQILLFGAVLTIFISCIGLFGLSVLSAEKRTKEIGIRKVLGASVNIVVATLSKDFLKLVFIALLVAIPLAWMAANAWLANYPYRVTLSWWMFTAAGILVLLLALATVSFQAIKAALANPVKSLRSE